ncbi:hypothetical protein UAY_02085 [Enterococcus moraviensis ATCC BAA-383]|uniref:Fungal lipase-like domain-containing protein n=1 Tax=Enterococcus moraviensis ATCC BAA-383 TaxID=1158609 RepID=R2T185_9ENTE|nr:hypothetical protein [Enterococcus moraviensis]EOH98816.1 hypothetical protein UAY_02085 [Enterococcus moraviensis ATCC BAA-383]EOT72009.1 hypothetical protein I586_01816 [Enterococcus moraviensis ATCC BAA-383]
MDSYEFNKDKIEKLNSNSENTSAISTIAYEVENAHFHKVPPKTINTQINNLKKKGKFPTNLDYIDSFYDPKTSSSGVAFLDNNTGKVVVGFAGTNGDNGKKDENKDRAQWINIALEGDGPSSSYFNASHTFMNDLKAAGYDIGTVTGHSLGGRNGAIMGMSHGIPNIVLYNSAPLMNMLVGLPTPRAFTNVNELDGLLKGYKGEIIYFVSEKDILNNVAGIGKASLYPGKIYVLKNGKPHDITGFLTTEEQNFIRQHTPDLNKIYVAQQKVQTDTRSKLKALDVLRAKLLKSGGGLSASEEIYLDASEALILTQGMSKTLQIEIEDIKKMYQEAKKDSDTLWTDTVKMGDSIGSTLVQGEVVDSLNAGGATEPIVRIEPKTEYEQKISELSSIQQDYYELIGQIQTSINKQVETDQALAQQIRG